MADVGLLVDLDIAELMQAHRPALDPAHPLYLHQPTRREIHRQVAEQVQSRRPVAHQILRIDCIPGGPLVAAEVVSASRSHQVDTSAARLVNVVHHTIRVYANLKVHRKQVRRDPIQRRSTTGSCFMFGNIDETNGELENDTPEAKQQSGSIWLILLPWSPFSKRRPLRMLRKDAARFAFTWSYGDTQESEVLHCLGIRCDIPEAMKLVTSCFSEAFQRFSRSMINSPTSSDY
ncbi:hypothetical protein QAD02_013169 [Eretmocerus hayati]|uniref:Uncharacterized protein n=1 Tax=Eretmocerus hayati TaxID=131215 RepID=A0ACC2P4N2_9HYME|nr:hypothetical protein QAD02_013169 [Eretmocerus hayati]